MFAVVEIIEPLHQPEFGITGIRSFKNWLFSYLTKTVLNDLNNIAAKELKTSTSLFFFRADVVETEPVNGVRSVCWNVVVQRDDEKTISKTAANRIKVSMKKYLATYGKVKSDSFIYKG